MHLNACALLDVSAVFVYLYVELLVMCMQAFVRSREDAVQFDSSRLVDFSERILMDIPALQVRDASDITHVQGMYIHA